MATVTLIRHGESVWNEARRMQGSRDAPLSERGRRQADLLVRHLPAYVPRTAAAVVSSPLLRAAETAERLARALHIPLLLDADLRELSLGRWEGLTVAEIQAAFPGRYERWREDPLAHPAPDSEPLEALAARTGSVLDRLRAAHPEVPLILVSHGCAIRSLLCRTLGMEIRHLFRLQQDNTAINQIDIAGASRRVIRLNDTTHLLAGGDAVAPRDVITDGDGDAGPTV